MSERELEETGSEEILSPERRKALTKLGIAAGVAYSAPTLVHLDRAAASKKGASPPGKSKGGGKGGGDDD